MSDEDGLAGLQEAADHARERDERAFLEECRALVVRFAGNHAYGLPCSARDEARALLAKRGRLLDDPDQALTKLR